MRDPLYAMLKRSRNWITLSFLLWLIYFTVGFGAAIAQGGSAYEGVQFGAGLVVWGGALRTVLVWHNTWSVNSVGHIWGYRNYETDDDSRNNAVVGFLTGGEGWHNNHHADPRSARHGHYRWEIDFAWQVIRLLAWLRLATNIVQPSPGLAAKFEASRSPSD
jgi:stearoyl-CoA desaturase (delta-9 desaturase)